MEVIECDRCKKRIGEKRDDLKLSKAKIAGKEMVLCVDCSEKLNSFIQGEDDLRTLFQGVHPATIREALMKAFPTSMSEIPEPAISVGVDLIIAALPNGGRF
jgi:hypothetical protein